MNKIIISGNLTRDIELYEKKDMKIGKFTVAVTRQYKNEKGEYESDFLNCVIFKPSDYIVNNLTKGAKVLIDGSIQTRAYEVDGNKRYSTDIIVSKVELISQAKKVEEKQEINPYKEFGQQFEIKEQEPIDMESEYPF